MEETIDLKLSKQPNKKGKKKKRRIILWIVLGLLVLASVGGGIYIWHVLKRPGSFFDSSVRVTATETPETTPAIDIEAYLPTPEPGTTPIPTAVPRSTAAAIEKPEETIPHSGIVNIALFGIDAYESGKSTSGTMPHTDASLVLAINFDTKEVSLISIARDCMTTAPGYRGFYKFNGIFNVGGGMADPKAGFELSSRAAEEWLGGVSIPYYYGVDFQALIDLVDMIGGIDFQVDITMRTLDHQIIRPGKRHLDGQGVMAYMRARKSAGGLDSNRTARQRKMLIAIFKKLKQEGKLSMIPDMLKTMGDNVYTNTSLSQTAALVSFAKDLNEEDIHTYSIQGEIRCRYDWAYCFIDQQSRLDIIKEVYGLDAEPMRINSLVYETYLHESGFKAIQFLVYAKNILTAVHDLSDSSTWTEEQKAAYAICWQDYQNLKQMYDYVDQWMLERYDDTVLSREEREERSEYYAALEKLETQMKKSGDALNEAFGKPVSPRWYNDVKYWYDKDSIINEVYVDFR